MWPVFLFYSSKKKTFFKLRSIISAVVLMNAVIISPSLLQFQKLQPVYTRIAGFKVAPLNKCSLARHFLELGNCNY